MSNCIACGAVTSPDGRFCQNCGAAKRAPPSCSRCGKPVIAGDKFCGHCGAAIEPIGASPTSQVVGERRRLSLWYPASVLGCGLYLVAFPLAGLAAMNLADDVEARLPMFLLGCLLAYPILTFWRGIFCVRGNRSRNQRSAVPRENRASSGATAVWIVILGMIAAGVIWQLRMDVLKKVKALHTNTQRWLAPPLRGDDLRPRTRPRDNVRQDP